MRRLRIKRIELAFCLLIGPTYFVIRGIIEGFTGTLLFNIVFFLLWWLITFYGMLLCGWIFMTIVESFFPGFRGEHGYYDERKTVASKKAAYAHVGNTISPAIGIKHDTMVADWNDQTLLHKAAEKGDIQEVKLLIDKGALVNAKDIFGSTPLYLAATKGCVDVVNLLIACGADINTKNDKGDTYLHTAALKGKQALCELLIASGANINAKNNEGDTPLHCLASAVYTVWMKQEVDEQLLVDLAKFLITNGAKVNATNNEGDTPLHILAPSGWQDLIKLLLANGADVDIKNNEGQTPKVSMSY
jgi:ankyrin repeat protein